MVLCGMRCPRTVQYVVVLLSLVVGGFLLQAAFSAPTSVRLLADGPASSFLEGFYPPERSTDLPFARQPGEGAYRWTGSRAVFLLGPVRVGEPLLLRLWLRSGRPAGSPSPQVELVANGRSCGVLRLPPSAGEYTFLLPPEALQDGMLELWLQTDSLWFPGDSRELGVVFLGAEIVALPRSPSGPFAVPDWPGWSAVGVGFALLGFALGWRLERAWAAGCGGLLLGALLDAWQPAVRSAILPGTSVGLFLCTGTIWLFRRLHGKVRLPAQVRAHLYLLLPALLLAGVALAFALAWPLLSLILVTPAVWSGHFLWLRRRYPSLADAGAGAFLLTALQVLVTEMLLGAFGWLRWQPVYGLNTLLAAVLWVGNGRNLSLVLRDVLLRAGAFWRALGLCARIALALLLVAALWSVLLAALVPAHDWDGNAYHIPIAILRYQRGDLARLDGFYGYIRGFPEHNELFMVWLLLGTHSQRLVDAVQLPFWAFALLSLYSLARRFGASPGPAILGASLWALAPVAILQTRTAYNDLTLASLFWLGMGFAWRHPARRVDTALAAAATGMLLGIKYYVLVLVPIVSLTALICAWRGWMRRVRLAALAWVAIWLLGCAPGLYWYFANLHDLGNPLWPFGVTVGPLRFPGPASVRGLQQEDLPAELRGLPLWRQLWTVWKENVQGYTHDTRLGGFGPLWLLLGLPALGTWLLLDRRAILWTTIGAAVLLLHTHPWWTRHVMLLPGLGGIALGVVLSRVRRPVARLAQAVFLGGTLYSLFICTEPQLLHYFLLPRAYRTSAIYWSGLPIYRRFEANARDSSAVLCYAPQGFLFLAPLAGEELQHRLLAFEEDASAEVRWIAGHWDTGRAPLLPPEVTPNTGYIPQGKYTCYLPLIGLAPPETEREMARFARVVPAMVTTAHRQDGLPVELVVYRVRRSAPR